MLRLWKKRFIIVHIEVGTKHLLKLCNRLSSDRKKIDRLVRRFRCNVLQHNLRCKRPVASWQEKILKNVFLCLATTRLRRLQLVVVVVIYPNSNRAVFVSQNLFFVKIFSTFPVDQVPKISIVLSQLNTAVCFGRNEALTAASGQSRPQTRPTHTCWQCRAHFQPGVKFCSLKRN